MKPKCDICGGKRGRLLNWQLKDGLYCRACNNKFCDIGLVDGETWRCESYTVMEAKEILANPESWRERIAQDNEILEKAKTLNGTCLTCGAKLVGHSQEWYRTSDGRALCTRCRDLCITISPDEFMQEKDGYIFRHDADFFEKNMGQAEHPHIQLSVNFSRQSFYDCRSLFLKPDNVFTFDSVVRFETDRKTYEVTVGKKGHPIARAVAGGVIFGPAGAVVGAMTAKDTRHNEIKEGRRYVNIYHRDASEMNGICVRKYWCDDDTDVIRLEDCLRRVFEFRDEKQEEEKEISGPGNDYSQLIELKKLMDAGIITQEEFDKKKKDILGL